MISIDLPAILEKRFWKEQFFEDVESIRAEMRHQGGIKEETIEDAIQRYRRNLGVSGA